MRLTRRGWIVVLTTAAVLGFTAHTWNPYASPYQYEDGSYADGTCEPGALCDSE